jgi:uncharacterized membrane protein YhaH (DUF805 family)
MTVGKPLFDFRGRASRLQFWVVVAIVVPALMVLLLCLWMYALSIPGAYENGGPTPMPTDPLGIAGAILWFAALAGLIAAFLAAAIRRLHDRGKAWWWIFVFLIVPDALYAYGRYLVDSSMGAAGEMPFVTFIYPACALYLWGLIELGFLPGSTGDNRSGPDPLTKQQAN